MTGKYEYKTFACPICSYKADVFGGEQVEYYGKLNTFTCLDCKILIESGTADGKLDKKTLQEYFVETEPICMMCGNSNLILWDSETCKCPKCENRMEMTRLEIGGPGQ
jgi:hypothetical protein